MATTTEYAVTGMTCGHCEGSVSSGVAQIAGVTEARASAQNGTLIVTSHAPLDDAAVLAAVDEAGYQAVRASV